MADRNRVADTSTMHRYRIELPILIDDLDLSVYEFRLYVRLKRRSGDGGSCWEGARALAKACGMSAGQVAKAKKGLEEKGLIRIGTRQTRGGQTDDITVVDLWPQNFETYARKESDHHTITLEESDHTAITSGQPITTRSLNRVSDQGVIALTSKRSPGDRKNHDHVGDGGDRARAKKILLGANIYPATVKQILAMDLDWATVITSVQTLLADGWGAGAIADRLRDQPPEKGQPYVRPEQPQRPDQPNIPPDRRKPSERIGERPALPKGLKLARRSAPDAGD